MAAAVVSGCIPELQWQILMPIELGRVWPEPGAGWLGWVQPRLACLSLLAGWSYPWGGGGTALGAGYCTT